ncbi:MAG: fibronectin type III domain-containing protein, partial [Bacteroidia bacterium]|nr:fibronectin type III domain-containing protein [Bacteroidia bacterium]
MTNQFLRIRKLQGQKLSYFKIIYILGLFQVFGSTNLLGQTTIFSENIGTPSGTTSIASYSGGTAPATFQNKGTLTYSDGGQTSPGDVRATSVSSAYTGASGNGNVFFTTTNAAYGFSIESVNASAFTSLSFQFGYRKESASLHATLSVDYWNGSSWNTVANTASVLFNEVASAATGWYLSKSLSLPSGAQISGLKIRFVKTGTASIRIDDVLLKGTPSSSPSITTVGTTTSFISSAVSTPSNEQTFTVSGANLTNNISITPPAGYQISITTGSGFGSSVTLTQSGGTVSSTTIYTRFNPIALSDQAGGNIILSSTGASSQNMAVTGEVINLVAGDIAFISFQGTGPDQFKIVAINDIPGNTRIWFTDKSWDGSLGTPAFTASEGNNVWTAPAGGVTKGTTIQFDCDAGTAVTGTGGLLSGLGSAGEQLFAYQGTLTAATFVAGFTSGSTISSASPTSIQTWVPTGLTAGTNYLSLGTNSSSAFLTNATQTASLAGHRSTIHNSTNWTVSTIATLSSWPVYTFTFLADEPTTNASMLSFSSITTTQFTLNWTSGNGANRIVVVKSGSAVTYTPTDGISPTGVNTNFTVASDQGSGNKIVYNSFGSSATITGLSASTTYHVAVYEYNGTSTTINYFTTSPATANQLTVSGPVISIDQTGYAGSYGNVVTGSNSSEHTYTVTGSNLSTNIVLATPAGFQISVTSASGFGSGITLTQSGGIVATTTIYVRYTPSSATGATGTLNITHTSTGATSQNVPVSGTSIDTEPATQASNITFGTITSNSIVLNFTTGSGAKRIVLTRSASAVNSDPVDATTYTANAAFTSGAQIGSGNYVMYTGTGNTITVTGLSASTIYYFAVYEYNDNGGISGVENYNVTSPAINNTATINTTYSYIGTGTSAWTTSSNWNPAGPPSAGDNVAFDGGGTIVVTSVPAITIKQLNVLNSTNVTLQGSATTLTTTSASSTGLSVANGSTLATGVTVNLTIGASTAASILGTLTIGAGTIYHTINSSAISTVGSTGV